MKLTPREKDKLMISMAANVARKRLERGVKLNYPEAIALITDFVIEGARDGKMVSELMETGTVAVNTPLVAIAEAPFGGIKQTGYGREGGSMAIKDYLNVKYTHLGIKG